MKTLTLFLFMVCIVMAGADDAKSGVSRESVQRNEDLGAVIVPEVYADNESASSVLNQLSKAMETGDAYKKGFKGILVASPDLVETKLSLRLRNVPFGFVVQSLADLLGCRVVERGGFVIIAPSDLFEGVTTVVTLPFDKQIREKLSLASPAGEAEIREAFQR